jgi:hypothetical protein
LLNCHRSDQPNEPVGRPQKNVRLPPQCRLRLLRRHSQRRADGTSAIVPVDAAAYIGMVTVARICGIAASQGIA